jgi:hypothetical protein
MMLINVIAAVWLSHVYCMGTSCSTAVYRVVTGDVAYPK